MASAGLAVPRGAFLRPDALISHPQLFAPHSMRGNGSKNRMLKGGMNVTALSDSELHASLANIGWVETQAVADGVEHLVEVERRKLHLTRGFPGLIDYCMEVLGCSRDVAANRVVAAHAVQRYPVVLAMLRERQLHLSGVRVIAQYLGDDT